MNITRDLQLPESEIMPTLHAKDLIVLHHTVGGSARSTFDYWRTDPERIGTAYIVERDGTIFEVFPPNRWAFHLGLKGSNGCVDKRSIGIELANAGGLIYRANSFYCFDRVSEQTRYTGPLADLGKTWRGYRFFADYTPAQKQATNELVAMLCERFSIPKRMPQNVWDANPIRLQNFTGILAHAHLRTDKSDVNPLFGWEELAAHISAEKVV